jgi:hypothetical protein
MSPVRVVVGGGLAIIVAILILTLLGSPLTVAAVSTEGSESIVQTAHRARLCQGNERIPGGTTAVRYDAYAFTGPRVSLNVLRQGKVIAHGERAAGWTGGSVTIPIDRVPRAMSGVELCLTAFLTGTEATAFFGSKAATTNAAQGHQGERLRIEYLRPGPSSWLSLSREVARRLGLGRAASGAGNAIVVLLLTLGAVALSLGLVLRTSWRGQE